MMHAVYQQKGATLKIEILADKPVQNFITTHADTLDSSFEQVPMSDIMRQRLQQSDYIFSGMKTFHELNEAFPSLLDDNGNRKSFDAFLNDVQKIDETYNKNYLNAEYNFVQASATMASKWEQIAEDGDDYDLQYRTVGDDLVRPEHAALDGVTLPPSDPFWDEYFPPNGWNCRCTVVQVRRDKYPRSDSSEAQQLGAEATKSDKHGFFRFNSGKQQKAMPDYNPYTIKRCNDCDVAKGKAKFVFVPDNDVCESCKLLHKCFADKSKSESAIIKKHYLHEMEPLLEKSIEKEEGGNKINIGFTKKGNKHLYSDTFGRTSLLSSENLKDLDSLIKNSEYKESADLTHKRKDHIVRFHYYETEFKDGTIRLNIGETQKKYKDGRIRNGYFLYSVNDVKK